MWTYVEGCLPFHRYYFRPKPYFFQPDLHPMPILFLRAR